jgi:excisionase family DNA binding protein
MLKYQTVREWSRDHKVSEVTTRSLIRSGMPAIRVGNQFRLDPAQTDAWLNAERTEVGK